MKHDTSREVAPLLFGESGILGARPDACPLPTVAGLIAATVLEHGLTLVTRNVGDCADTGVALLNPFEPGT